MTWECVIFYEQLKIRILYFLESNWKNIVKNFEIYSIILMDN